MKFPATVAAFLLGLAVARPDQGPTEAAQPSPGLLTNKQCVDFGSNRAACEEAMQACTKQPSSEATLGSCLDNLSRNRRANSAETGLTGEESKERFDTHCARFGRDKAACDEVAKKCSEQVMGDGKPNLETILACVRHTDEPVKDEYRTLKEVSSKTLEICRPYFQRDWRTCRKYGDPCLTQLGTTRSDQLVPMDAFRQCLAAGAKTEAESKP